MPIESVPTTTIAVNALPVGAFGTFAADEIIEITSEDLVGQFGPRVPDFTSSQKSFTGAFVGISDEPLNQATMTYLDRLAQGLAGNAFGCTRYLDFSEATGGAGSLDTSIQRIKVFKDRFEDETSSR